MSILATRNGGRVVQQGQWAGGTELTRFHIEAAIAACHALGTTYATTDWARIAELYDMLRQCAPSVVVDVNRALAKAMDSGARVGLDELDAIPEREVLARYPYALAAYADLNASLGNLDEARAYLDRALASQSCPAQHALLKRKRAALDETHTAAVFGSDRPGGTVELRARLEGYWTRTLDSLKARLETDHVPDDSESD